jgi:hypothetical protein
MASKKDDAVDIKLGDVEEAFNDGILTQKGDILQLDHTDPVLNAKMHLVNDVSTQVIIG